MNKRSAPNAWNCANCNGAQNSSSGLGKENGGAKFCEFANTSTHQWYKVATSCIDDHQFKEEEIGSVGKFSKVCAQIVLKCMYLARIGRRDILWSVNKLARAITKWTRACDKRLTGVISHIHHTSEFKQYCHV